MSLENKIIDYNIHKEDILHWVNLKGEYRYENIIDFLEKNNIECTWKHVSDYIKYDKRILINCFKYFTFLEEFYRSYVIQYHIIDKDNLKNYYFSTAIDNYLQIKENKAYEDIDLALLEKEKKTIIDLRNTVVHNNILLINKYNEKSLKEALVILVNILPKSYRKGYISDINKCKRNLAVDQWFINLTMRDS